MALDWGQLFSTALSAAGSAYSANQGAKGAQQAAAATATNPFSVFTPYGSVVNNGQRGLVIGSDQNNPFANLATIGGLQQGANAFSAPSAAYYGAPSEVANAANGAMNTDADAANRLQLLRDQAAPDANRQAVALRDRLFGRGTLGSSGGGAEQRAFLDSQNQADLNRQMTAADWANQRAQQRFSNALGATGLGAQLQNQQFNQFGASQQVQMNPFAQMLQAAGIGVGAGGGQSAGAAVNAANAGNVPYQMGAQALSQLLPMFTQQSSAPKTTQPVGYGGAQAVGYQV